MTIPVFLYGQENNVWLDRGIDFSFEVTGYGQFIRCFSGDQCTGAGVATTFDFPQDVADGVPVQIFSPSMTEINHAFVRADSDIEGPADLEGRVMGADQLSSGTTQSFRAYWIEEHGFDLMEDTDEIVDASSASLYDMLVEDEEIDAAIMFTGFTIDALADDRFRSISYLADEWTDQTGYPPQVTMHGAFENFVTSSPDAVLSFWEGWVEAVELFESNFEDAIAQYGVLAGLDLEDDAEMAEVERLVEEAPLFPTDWGEGWIDSHVEFYDMLERNDAIDSAPGRDSFLLHDELE
ncbi:ABC transporter substrate-binding protein [Natrarchaeobius chitinivorans]|nr:ABC transporter substrate-binding protein [Natrarchaeobius chitinivorans]